MWGLNAGLVETLSLVLRTRVFTSTLPYFHNDVNLLYYHGQGNWLVSSIIQAFNLNKWLCHLANELTGFIGS